MAETTANSRAAAVAEAAGPAYTPGMIRERPAALPASSWRDVVRLWLPLWVPMLGTWMITMGLLFDMKGDIAANQVAIASLREEVRGDIGSLREELHREIAGLREELHREIAGLREEMLREMADLRVELGERLTRVETLIGVLLERHGLESTGEASAGRSNR